jgi:hypothetical protein
MVSLMQIDIGHSPNFRLDYRVIAVFFAYKSVYFDRPFKFYTICLLITRYTALYLRQDPLITIDEISPHVRNSGPCLGNRELMSTSLDTFLLRRLQQKRHVLRW